MGEPAGAMSRRCVVKVVTLTEIQLLQVGRRKCVGKGGVGGVAKSLQ